MMPMSVDDTVPVRFKTLLYITLCNRPLVYLNDYSSCYVWLHMSLARGDVAFLMVCGQIEITIPKRKIQRLHFAFYCNG